MVRLLAFLTAALGCRVHEEEVSMQKKSSADWEELDGDGCGKLELHLGGTWEYLGHREPGLPHPPCVSPAWAVPGHHHNLPPTPSAPSRLPQGSFSLCNSPLTTQQVTHSAGLE